MFDSNGSELFDRAYASQLDERDPLASYRNRFAIPQGPQGRSAIYLCGNSLGLMPLDVPGIVNQELEDWAKLGVAGHFEAHEPWFSYHEAFREMGAALVGAAPGEVVMMNSLTVNLHLMMASFYQPTEDRCMVLMEDTAFPSDRYAVMSHVEFRGIDPKTSVVMLRPRSGEHLALDDFERIFAEYPNKIALIVLAGVNFANGQLYELEDVCRLAQREGSLVGFDLAHAAGNVPLALHDWNVDFAVWCSYKYLNAGPGAVAGCFVHERHGQNRTLPRLAGWWGNDPADRFRMERHFVPRVGADGWQLSNPPILSMAPLKVSLSMFAEAGMSALRAKSVKLTGYLASLLHQLARLGIGVITPSDENARGCQLSLTVPTDSKQIVEDLYTQGIVVDHRPPNIIRVAPVPLYNTFTDVLGFVSALAEHVSRYATSNEDAS